jgi:hypothetical protein
VLLRQRKFSSNSDGNRGDHLEMTGWLADDLRARLAPGSHAISYVASQCDAAAANESRWSGSGISGRRPREIHESASLLDGESAGPLSVE